MTIVKQIKPIKNIKPIANNDPIGIPDFDHRLSIIRERAIETDIVEEWEILKEWIKEEVTSIQDMRRLIRQHADMAERAKNIFLIADTELKDFMVKYKDRKQIWRTSAIKYWEVEKSAGLHKQITEDMLEDWMIEHHSDLYIELQTRKIHLEEICARLKSLSSRVGSRGQDLRKLLESETRRPVTPNWMDDEKKK